MCIALSLVAAGVQAEDYLLENVRIFNGVDAKLTAGHLLPVHGRP